jgi:FtsZ-binding cell division protein ZapB
MKAIPKALKALFDGGSGSNQITDSFTQVLIKILSSPFPFKEFSNLLSELSDKDKRSIAKLLNVNIKIPADRQFPDDQLSLVLRSRISKPSIKRTLLQAIYACILPLYEETGHFNVNKHLEKEEELINKFGPWHYYWSLLLFPIEDDRVSTRMEELKSTLPEPKREGAELDTSPKNKKDKQNEKEQIIRRERELRQAAERETDAVNKELRNLQKEWDRLNKLVNELSEKNNEINRLADNNKEAYLKEKSRAVALEREKAELARQLRRAEETIESLQERNRSLDSQIAKLRTEIDNLEHELQSLKNQDNPVNSIIQALYSKVDNLYQQLRKPGASTKESALRKKISDALLLMNKLECCFREDNYFGREQNESDPVLEIDALIEETAPYDEISAQNQRRLLGTFYRRDHGGFIILENNEIYNIPESMVHHARLEHEAAVSCELSHLPDGPRLQNIQVLLQGDDLNAPIHKYVGYVKLGEHYRYYCVDINDPDKRFPIHEKDVEIQKPQDGDPCLFNVATDGQFARISKLYKGEEYAQIRQTDTILKSKSFTQVKSNNDKQPSEPFLEGCRIVVVGGLAKWFESVVNETGAEFIHDTGDNPERVHAQLRRANALFLLLTRNSHWATWSCIEIAKRYGVPHFKIEGSKSNLRKQLWENRDKIRGEQQLVQQI